MPTDASLSNFLKPVPTVLADIDWQNWQPEDPATLLFVIQDQQILLIRKKRGLGAGKINAPGGKLDKGESPLECALRETQEELLIDVDSPEYCGEHLFQFVDGYSLHVYVYRAENFTGTPTETDEAAPLWFPVDAIPYDEMWVDDQIWLPLVLQRKKFFARWLFAGDKLLDYKLSLVDQ